MKTPFNLPSNLEKRKILREFVRNKELTIVPGIYNAATAMIAEDVGFEIIYLGGAATTLGMGLPDLGIISIKEMVYECEKIVRMTSSPLICDGDTGYTDVSNTVRMFEKSGASGIHIEDQIEYKKCGHLSEISVIDREDMVKKIQKAIQARKDPNFVIIARTDARSAIDIEEMVQRANLYMEAGADMIFPEALRTKDEFQFASSRIKAPLIANMTEFGKTPYLKASDFGNMGYRFVLFPATTLRSSLKAVEETLIELKDNGTQMKMIDNNLVKTRKELQDLIRYKEWEELMKKDSEYNR